MNGLEATTYIENYLRETPNLPDDVKNYLLRIESIEEDYNAESNWYDVHDTYLRSIPPDQDNWELTRDEVANHMDYHINRCDELLSQKIILVHELRELIAEKIRQRSEDPEEVLDDTSDSASDETDDANDINDPDDFEESDSDTSDENMSESSSDDVITSSDDASDENVSDSGSEEFPLMTNDDDIGDMHETDSSNSTGDILEDADDVLYCICERTSFGRMIQCDNDICPRVWFHFSCVDLLRKPRGCWYCPGCRGESHTIPKPREQQKQDLADYNKAKEDDFEMM